MKGRSRSKPQGFLSKFDLAEGYLLKPDTAHGRAGILSGTDEAARDVLIKFWERGPNQDSEEFEEIWKSEVRQLQRMAALPRADELFVPLLKSERDKSGSYLVFDIGRGEPLAVHSKRSRKPPVLVQPQVAKNRRHLWLNFRRLVEAIDLLHSQGAIHRNIDEWAIVTSFGVEPDFRLTGFEWSMRIAAIDQTSEKIRSAPNQEPFSSFVKDWRDLATLFARLLDVSLQNLNDSRITPSLVAPKLFAAEIRLLRILIGMDSFERLEGTIISARIDEIVESITAEMSGAEPKLCLAVRLDPSSKLSAAIRSASVFTIEMGDTEGQFRFVLDDLGDHPQLVGSRSPFAGRLNYYLVGRLLTYRLMPFQSGRRLDADDWEFTECDFAETDMPDVHTDSIGISSSVLSISKRTDAIRNFPRRRGRVQHWRNYIKRIEPSDIRRTELDRQHQAFALMLMLEMAFSASEVFPVRVLSGRLDRDSDSQVISLELRHDADRANLSDALGIDSPANRLLDALDREDVRDDAGWVINKSGSLGERENQIPCRFVSKSEDDDLGVLQFVVPKSASIEGNAFLAPAKIAGQIPQFRRRIKALAALRDHTELLKMFIDPRHRVEASHDRLREDKAFEALDPSKQAAVREILGTVPFFLLQGPPGVGKTFLVAELVRRRFADEPASRILLSAQSNAAVDHLMDEIDEILADSETPPFMVRSRSGDDDEPPGKFEIRQQASTMLAKLRISKLVRDEASDMLKQRVLALAESTAYGGRGGGTPQSQSSVAAEVRALEGMILRAANVVFATTNSSAVERLIQERGLFDWSIVEEAGKATGGELISPLLLSHRRLMIGDHKQLPPFDAKKLIKILSSPADVRNGIEVSERMISRHLRDSSLDDLFTEIRAGSEDLARTCADALRAVCLFETYIETQLAQQKAHPEDRPIARRLKQQHRMHPAISALVSECFYDHDLETFPKKDREFRTKSPPFISTDGNRLPETPIVFVDLPYARQAAPGMRTGDRAPAWSNPDEVRAVIKILGLVKGSENKEKRPTLAVLSPYQEQVKALRLALIRFGEDKVSSFAPAILQKHYCGTVDSFQGGQADLVVVSLVRNNVHTAPRKALGFLEEKQRMNVLLSRAKWRLVLVGSLPFYRHVAGSSSGSIDNKIVFISDFLNFLDRSTKAGDASIVPVSKLFGTAG